MPSDWTYMPWFGMFMMPVMMIIFLLFLIAILVPILRWLGFGPQSWNPHHPPGSKSALDILNERLARGEIDKNEYEEKRRLIS